MPPLQPGQYPKAKHAPFAWSQRMILATSMCPILSEGPRRRGRGGLVVSKTKEGYSRRMGKDRERYA